MEWPAYLSDMPTYRLVLFYLNWLVVRGLGVTRISLLNGFHA